MEIKHAVNSKCNVSAKSNLNGKGLSVCTFVSAFPSFIPL